MNSSISAIPSSCRVVPSALQVSVVTMSHAIQLTSKSSISGGSKFDGSISESEKDARQHFPLSTGYNAISNPGTNFTVVPSLWQNSVSMVNVSVQVFVLLSHDQLYGTSTSFCRQASFNGSSGSVVLAASQHAPGKASLSVSNGLDI